MHLVLLEPNPALFGWFKEPGNLLGAIPSNANGMLEAPKQVLTLDNCFRLSSLSSL